VAVASLWKTAGRYFAEACETLDVSSCLPAFLTWCGSAAGVAEDAYRVGSGMLMQLLLSRALP
jgi:hypothetical protein